MSTTGIVKPVRTAFRYMEDLGRRPTAYEEATYRVQPVEHFHYRPLWNPEIEIFDRKMTALTLPDWEAFSDPDRLYYATYCYSRADWENRIADTFEQARRLGLWEHLSPELRRVLVDVVVPLRHVHYGEMVVGTYIGRFAFGTAIEQAATYTAYDHMGAAQLITRMAKELEELEPTVLTESKTRWLHDANLQPLRKLVEEQMALTDWSEAMVATTLCLDLLLHELLYSRLAADVAANGGAGYALVAGHLNKFSGYARKWATALVALFLKGAGEENLPILQGWIDKWLPKAFEAVRPLAAALDSLSASKGSAMLDAIVEETVRPLLEGVGLEVPVNSVVGR